MGSMPFVVNTLGAQHANLLGDLELTQLLWKSRTRTVGSVNRMKVIIAHPKHAKCGVIKTNKGMYNSMQNIHIYI